MSTTLVALFLFVILALVVFSIALLYKNKVEGHINILGMKFDLKTRGDSKQRQAQVSNPPEAVSEVNIQAEMKDAKIGKVAGRDINEGSNAENTLPSKSKVVIGGKLKNVELDQVAGRDIKSTPSKKRSSKQKSSTPKRKP